MKTTTKEKTKWIKILGRRIETKYIACYVIKINTYSEQRAKGYKWLLEIFFKKKSIYPKNERLMRIFCEEKEDAEKAAKRLDKIFKLKT